MSPSPDPCCLQVLRYFAEIEQYVNKLWECQNFVEFKAFEDRRKESVVAPPPAKKRPPRLRLMSRVVVVPPDFVEKEEELTESAVDLHSKAIPREQVSCFSHILAWSRAQPVTAGPCIQPSKYL